MVHMIVNHNGKQINIPAQDAVRVSHESVTGMVQHLLADIQRDALKLALTLKLDECENYYLTTGDVMVKATVERWTDQLHVELYVCKIERFASFKL